MPILQPGTECDVNVEVQGVKLCDQVLSLQTTNGRIDEGLTMRVIGTNDDAVKLRFFNNAQAAFKATKKTVHMTIARFVHQ